MKLYNIATDKIENKRVIEISDGTLYVNKLTDEQLNSYGYYKVKYTSAPNRRYYNVSTTASVVGSEYVVGYTVAEKPLEEVKASMLKDLKETFIALAERPIVDTGLGYSVDGGRKDLENFQIGQEFGFPAVKDVDGMMQPITTEEYNTVILAIKTAGVMLYQQKWAKEEEITTFTTVEECILYEATPYDYTITAEDVANDIDGTLTLGGTIVRYKNNVTTW